MDVTRIIQQLTLEKELINHAITQLQRLETTEVDAPAKKRRGRPSLSPEERLRVAERMRKYWSDRRQNRPV